jgi:hypothetical protein
MARLKSQPRGLRDLKNIPADSWVDNRGRPNILNYDAPIGHYEVDHIVVSMLEEGGIVVSRSKTENVTNARELIDCAGGVAIKEARADLSAPLHYKEATNLRQNLSAILDHNRRIQRIKIAEIAHLIKPAQSAAVKPFAGEAQRLSMKYGASPTESRSISKNIPSVTYPRQNR